jgi:hypothetical protein
VLAGTAEIAGEPVLILTRLAVYPVDWALTARIWTEVVKVADQRPWRILAKAILVRNEGATETVVIVTSLVPSGADRRIDEPSPGSYAF